MIAQHRLRDEIAGVVDAVLAGESFLVTRNGQPVAELVPTASHRPVFARRADIARLARADVRIDRRQVRLQEAESMVSPIPFDALAVRSYGLLVAAVIDMGRKPKSRFADLLMCDALRAFAHRATHPPSSVAILSTKLRVRCSR